MKSTAELMRDVAELPPQAQQQMASYLVQLRLQQDDEWRREMARKIDDKNPANWVSLEELQRRFPDDQAA